VVVSDEIIINRLGGRCVCQNKNCQAVYSSLKGSSLASQKFMTCDLCSSALVRRNDDDVATIKNRLRSYYEYETPLLNFYNQRGRSVHELNVDKDINVVFEDFKELVGVE
jgi:adenylate kinase